MGTGLAQRGGGLGTDSRARPRRGGRGGSEEIDKGTRLCRSRTARAPSPSPPASGAEVAPRAPDRFSNEHLHPRARPPAAVKEGSPPPGLIAGEELHVEDEGGVGGDGGGGGGGPRQRRRRSQGCRSARHARRRTSARRP